VSPTKKTGRVFTLCVQPAEDSFGLTVQQANGHGTIAVATVPASDLTRYLPTVNAALKDSGHKPTVLGSARGKPIPLNEAAGVRLVLGIQAAAPLKRTARAFSVLNGVSTMSDEEAYYWHAKTSHPEAGTRALRALRILLADDHRSGITS
jgi:hypothetical protein